MKRTFIEVEGFRKRIDRYSSSDLLSSIQSEILKDPSAGDLIPGTGGVRKLRLSDSRRGKGKRGGFRIIYLDLSAVKKTYLIWIYGKNESEDISSEEKKIIADLVTRLKKEAYL